MLLHSGIFGEERNEFGKINIKIWNLDALKATISDLFDTHEPYAFVKVNRSLLSYFLFFPIFFHYSICKINTRQKVLKSNKHHSVKTT